jgi:hypothetical protein
LGRPSKYADARQIGLPVEYLPPTNDRWSRYWELHCLLRLEAQEGKKIFKSAYGVALRRRGCGILEAGKCRSRYVVDSRYSGGMKLAVSTNSAIDPNIPTSLKGKRIATRIGTSGQYLVAKYLELAVEISRRYSYRSCARRHDHGAHARRHRRLFLEQSDGQRLPTGNPVARSPR